MQYFDHSTTAASDDKVLALRLECGGAAVDAYWAILEQIHRDETPLVFFGNQHVTKSVSHRLCTTEKQLEEWVSRMLEIGLLSRDVENHDAITSKRAAKNIESYQEKRETARQNGKKGGRKPTRKPKANQAGSEQETNAETGRKANKTKQRYGLPNGNPIPSGEGGADAGEPAPPPPVCSCGAAMEPTNSYTPNRTARYWSCPSCGESVAVRGGADA